MRLLFICHGNICRSPMAEFVMKDLIRKAGLTDRLEADSAAARRDALGEPVYPPVRRLLLEHGIDPAGKTARLLVKEDFGRYDLLIGMDSENLRDMRRLGGPEAEGKCSLLLSWAGLARDVADPWYTRDFERTWQDVQLGCRALLEKLL